MTEKEICDKQRELCNAGIVRNLQIHSLSHLPMHEK